MNLIIKEIYIDLTFYKTLKEFKLKIDKTVSKKNKNS